MTWHISQKARGRQSRFVPSLETLEDRCVLNANFKVVGSTLFITAPTRPGDATGDRIVINDDGTSAPNNVTVFSKQAFKPNVPISKVVVNTGAGPDHVSYNLTGDLVGSRNVLANLGGGKNTFTAIVRRNLLSGASLSINANGGRGNNTLLARVIGSLFSHANLQVNFNGGKGSNNLQFVGAIPVNVSEGAALGINLNGGGRSDHISAAYSGIMNGVLSLQETGSRGNDVITGDIDLAAASVGTVSPSHVSGLGGNDFLAFVVHNPGLASASNNFLDGGGGNDSCVRTTNVFVTRCKHDQLVP